MQKVFYQIFILLYPLAARILANFQAKARLWVKGREEVFTQLSAAFKHNQSRVVWVHCASLGEFEQGKPIMEAIKKQYSHCKLLVTFFSPSGYEVRKNDAVADWVFYLPMDSNRNAKRFVKIVRPTLVLFVKYEFWYYYLKTLKDQQIPTLLVSGIFREDQPFFAWYGGFNRSILTFFNHLFVQNKACAQLLKGIGIERQVTVSGDTRFDRVLAIAEKAAPIPEIEAFIGNDKQVIVAGSTWLDDDKVLHHYAVANPAIIWIIAPHDISPTRMEDCLRLYPQAITYSAWVKQPKEQANLECQVLIMDNMGMLSRLYQYATIAFVGGGFGADGVHNVLEAAVYAKPVVIGPAFSKYAEAVDLVDAGGAFSVNEVLSLEKVLNLLLKNPAAYQKAGKAAGFFVQVQSGATAATMQYIYENRLLIK